MSMNYVGYGFNAEDEIPQEDLLKFIEKYDGNLLIKICMEVIGKNVPLKDLTAEEKEDILYELEEYVEAETEYASVSGYIARKINDFERAEGRMKKEDVVAVYDEYVVFENLRFAEDGVERSKRILSADEFIKFIKGFFHGVPIAFGNVWDGTEWGDPNYFME